MYRLILDMSGFDFCGFNTPHMVILLIIRICLDILHGIIFLNHKRQILIMLRKGKL